MTNKKVVTGTKVVTGNRNVDFVSVAPFDVNDEKIISDENVANATTCDFPCKILKNFTVILPNALCSIINVLICDKFRHQ